MEENRLISDGRGDGAAIKKLKKAADAIDSKNDKVAKFMERLTTEMESRREDDAHWIKNENWEYSAPDVDLFEIAQDEFYENEFVEANQFLFDIKRTTNRMRKGGESADNGWVQLFNDNGGIPYREIYLSHWQEFAAALKQYKRGGALEFTGIELPQKVRCILWNAMKDNHSFTQFSFMANNHDEGGIQFVLGLLETNPQIEALDCIYNNISNDNADILCSVVSKHPSLVNINLLGSVIGRSGYDLVCSLVRSGLKRVTVSDCQICSNGSNALSDILAINSEVEELNLADNHLDDNDAIGIANALQTNTNLKSLSLYNSSMTGLGEAALRGAVFDPSCLNSTARSNHTCRVLLKESILEEEPMNYNDNKIQQCYRSVNRLAKIYNILATRNKSMSNIEHFADIGIELLPDILCAVGIYSKGESSKRMSSPGKRWKSNSPFQINLDIKPLSIVYEIMRSWDKAFACYEDLGATAAVSLESQCILI